MRLGTLIDTMKVVSNRARLVAGTKTLHHLLPDLVPPMDRAWTGVFFGFTPLDFQNHQEEILSVAFVGFAAAAAVAKPSRLVGNGWRTSLSKVVDNAMIGYCKESGIGPAS